MIRALKVAKLVGGSLREGINIRNFVNIDMRR